MIVGINYYSGGKDQLPVYGEVTLKPNEGDALSFCTGKGVVADWRVAMRMAHDSGEFILLSSSVDAFLMEFDGFRWDEELGIIEEVTDDE